jgi:hypothetical protein
MLLLGPSLLPCFALSFLLTLRHALLAADAQASALIALAELNGEARDVDMDECLERALRIYAKTPPGLFRAWHSSLQASHDGTNGESSQAGTLPVLGIHSSSDTLLPKHIS